MELFYVRKNFVWATAVVSLFFFSACEDDNIPVPLPPPLPSISDAQAEDNIAKTDSEDPFLESIKSVPSVESPPAAAKEPPPPPPPSSPPPSKPDPVAKPISAVKKVTTYEGNTEQLNYGKYTIQIAIFPNEGNAKKLVKKMANNNINSYYAKVDNPAQLLGSYYRVRVGYFDEKPVAENFARARLEPLGYTWWVDRSNRDNIGSSSYASDQAYDKAQAKAEAKAQAKAEAKAQATEAKAKAKAEAKAKVKPVPAKKKIDDSEF
jgi:cell division septation protein DedD